MGRVIGQQDNSNVLQNYQAGSLDRWLRAQARVRGGTANGKLAIAGDSLALGAYAAGPTANGVRPGAPNVKIAALLNAAGLPAQSNNFMGNGSTGSATAFALFDSRVTPGSWASTSAFAISAGGYGARATVAATMSFTFTGAADSIDIYEAQYPTAGAYSVNIDGSTTVTASQATSVGPAAQKKRTLTFAAVGSGAHTVNILWVSGSPIIFGCDIYLSTAKSISCMNVAMGGSVIAEWNIATPTSGALFSLTNTIVPDLTMFQIGANNWTAGTDVTTFRTALNAFTAGVKAVSDIILVTPNPSQNSYIPLTTQAPYVDAIKSVAIEQGVPFIDEWASCRSWEAQNTLSQTQDNVHPNALGVWRKSQLWHRALMAA